MDWVCHDGDLRPLLHPDYVATDLDRIAGYLDHHRTLDLHPFANGLYPASAKGGADPVSGYGRVWLRDNVHVAASLLQRGEHERAMQTLRSLLLYLHRQRQRFEDIIGGRADPDDVMQRPHVRFDGETLQDLDERWPHAQNDALGSVLWLATLAVTECGWRPDERELDTLGSFEPYFRAIRYWQDPDSGHWEEERKLNCSSVGVVVAALRRWRELLNGDWARLIPTQRVSARHQASLDELILNGERHLRQALPDESPPRRGIDAALLFLVEPMEAVGDAMAEQIVAAVEKELMGAHGIRRYRGDSYWCADYRTLLSPERRSADFSQSLADRDRLLRPGEEAQWSLFDPVLSTYWGKRYERSGRPEERQRQVLHFNRSLGQLTDEGDRFTAGQSTEAWFVESSQEGRYRPNDHTPLAWTQANLALAWHVLRRTTR